MGFDLRALESEGRLVLDHVGISGAQAASGEWGLDGLLLRLGDAIDSVGATRVVIDTIEVLFGAFDDEGALRAELRRLFTWLKARDVTAVVTAERGEGTLTRHGIEEYVRVATMAATLAGLVLTSSAALAAQPPVGLGTADS